MRAELERWLGHLRRVWPVVVSGKVLALFIAEAWVLLLLLVGTLLQGAQSGAALKGELRERGKE